MCPIIVAGMLQVPIAVDFYKNINKASYLPEEWYKEHGIKRGVMRV